MATETVELLDELSESNTVGNDPETKWRKNSLAFFHPNNNGTGSFVTFSVNAPEDDKRGVLWVKLVPQKAGTKVGDSNLFSKEKSEYLNMKLNAIEVGAILYVLNGNKDKIDNSKDGKFPGLTHKSTGGTRTLYFDKQQYGFRLSINVAGGNNIGFNLFDGGECVVLADFLNRALGKMSPI